MGSLILNIGLSSGKINVMYSLSVDCSAINNTLGKTNGIMSALTHSFVNAGKIRCKFTLCKKNVIESSFKVKSII